MQTNTNQRILQVSLLYLKKVTRNPSKVTAAKNLSSSVYDTGATCFDQCLLLHPSRYIPAQI